MQYTNPDSTHAAGRQAFGGIPVKLESAPERPPQKSGMPTWGWLLVGCSGFLAPMLFLSATSFLFLCDNPDAARWDTTATQMFQIQSALNQYHISNGAYPSSLNVLHHPDYFPNGVPRDPWTEGEFRYSFTATGFELVCYGKDQAPGGAEKPDKDIVYDEAGMIPG